MIERDVDLILHGGDLIDHARPTPAEYCIAERALDRAAKQAWTVLVGCNHMMSQSATEQHGIAPLDGRHDRLLIALKPSLRTLSTKAGNIQIATLPFPQRSLLQSKDEHTGKSPAEIHRLIADKLASIVRELRASLDPSIPSLILTHMLTMEAVFGTDQSADFGMLAMRVEDFEGFDLAVAGDVHRHQMIGDRFLIPGSSDRISFGEEHEPKGWCCVEIDGPGAVPRVELVETPARRYLTLTPDQLQDGTLFSQFEDAPLETVPIVRVKGTVSQEELDLLQPFLATWRQIPTWSEEITVIRETRARSKEMVGSITPEGALRLWHETNNRPEDLERVLAAHRKIAGEVR
jgi:DNA repair exonuclease SbcCD nuclease subunit